MQGSSVQVVQEKILRQHGIKWRQLRVTMVCQRTPSPAASRAPRLLHHSTRAMSSCCALCATCTATFVFSLARVCAGLMYM